MGLVRFALHRPWVVLVAALLCALLGTVAALRLPADILPVFATPAVQIVTFYPGMPAEVMEKDITSRLERWTGQSNGIARQESKSMVGVSVVKDFFREDIDPNTAMSQVTSLAMSDLYYLPPGTAPPMVMPFDPTASIPLALLTVFSETHDEKTLYDIAYFELRNRLQGITGVIAPAVYGGKLRRILSYVDRDRLQARGLSPMDVVDALQRGNTLVPTGSARLGDVDYQVQTNGIPTTVAEMDGFPIRVDDEAAVFVKDVARVKDTAAIQTNVVRVNGRRQVYIPIYRQPGANTLEIVSSLERMLPPILERLPRGVQLAVAFDQSVYVKDATASLQQEAWLGGGLALLAILLFLRSGRSTAIVGLALPLSVLAALLGLWWTGNSLNIMTLGGLALVLGRLVDDAIVVLENTHRHLQEGKSPWQAALDAAGEVAMPVAVATLTTAVVFLPVVFLTGLGRFLFTPLALTVALAIGASYLVAMTLVPVCCARFLRATPHGGPEAAPRGLARIGAAALHGVTAAVRWSLAHRLICGAAVALLLLLAAWLSPRLGTELVPPVEAGQFTVRVRAPSGTPLEATERIVADVERVIEAEIPAAERSLVIANVGVLLDWPAAYTPNSGPMDAFLLVQLTPQRRQSVAEHVRRLRPILRERHPGVEIFFETGGMLTAALNFGLPSPIDIQIEGNKLDVAQQLAHRVLAVCEAVPGAVDARIQQKLDYPQLLVDVDRTRAALRGLDQRDVVRDVVTAFNSSVNFSPAFWIDERNGNHYFLGAQYAEADIRSTSTLEHVPIGGDDAGEATLLKDIATFRRGTAPAEIHHRNITRVTDVFVGVDGRDVGSVATDIERGLAALRAELRSEDAAARAAGKSPPWEGYRIEQRGEIQSMTESFAGLRFGLLLASVLVYLVLVAQFRSFVTPLIVMAAVPLGLIGVVVTLWATKTSLNVQSFLGTVFMIGIAVSNSVLLVEFADRQRAERGLDAAAAALASVRIRLRPVMMTSLAAVLGLLPMAIGSGHGGSANAPLARAVVGGLTASTVLVLVFVPVLYSLLPARRARESHV